MLSNVLIKNREKPKKGKKKLKGLVAEVEETKEWQEIKKGKRSPIRAAFLKLITKYLLFFWCD